MVFTIHRYIFRDLLKIFLLTTVVLSVVLGLGFMLRPLRQFNIDPTRAGELILCTLPITITMVLPIAALLAATLVYGRLAALNEITACRSSGISLKTLIYPALTLALLVGAGTLLLSFHIIPSFIAQSEAIIKADAEAMIYRNIEKKGGLGQLFPGVQIHADYADPENHRLVGVTVIRQEGGQVYEIHSARQVKIDLAEKTSPGRILLRLYDHMVVDSENRSTFGKLYTLSLPMPRLFQDDIKFKNLDDLKAIQNNLLLFEPIRNVWEKFREQFIRDHFIRWCLANLSQRGRIDLTFQNGSAAKLFIPDTRNPPKGSTARSPDASRVQLKQGKSYLLLSGRDEQKPLRVEYYQGAHDSQPAKVMTARAARLMVPLSDRQSATAIRLENVEISYRNDTRVSTHRQYDLPGVVIPETLLLDAQALSLGELLQDEAALNQAGPSESLRKLYNQSRKMCDELQAEIHAELHGRLAFGVSCLVLVLLGAGLGITFQSSHLLTAFGISCIPAAFCLITIFTGKHLAEQNPYHMGLGIFFLWSGILLTGLINLIVYKKLLKQ